MILAERSEEIFGKAESRLVSIAKRYGLYDPAGEARSWFLRFKGILIGFDEGRYEKRYKTSDGHVHVLPENPTEEENTLFEKSLVAYIKTAFANDIKQHLKRQKRIRLVSDFETEIRPDPAIIQQRVSALAYDRAEIITLSEMLHIIEADTNRSERRAAVARERLNHLFLKAVVNFYTKMYQEYGDFSIVRDYFAENSRDFFVYDIREGRTEGIRDELEQLIGEEPIRAVVLISGKLLAADKGYYALNRKISRYFNDEQGGMAARLKRFKER